MNALVDFRDVAFAYPRPAERRGPAFAFRALSFVIERGEVFGVIGPNSAGKTSLLRLLTRVLVPQRGEIRLDGRPLAALQSWELNTRSMLGAALLGQKKYADAEPLLLGATRA